MHVIVSFYSRDPRHAFGILFRTIRLFLVSHKISIITITTTERKSVNF